MTASQPNEGFTPAQVSSASSGPRLRLHHLFALTAVMGVLLAIGGRQPDFSNPQFQPPQLVRTAQQGFGILIMIPQAVALTALGYGVAGYRRGRPFFHQPGHWILAEISLLTLLSLPVALAARSVNIQPQMGFGDSSMIVMMIAGIYSLLFLFGGRIAFNVYLAVTKCAEGRWRNVFIAKAVAAAIPALADIAIIVLVLLANRADLRAQIPRDEFHRCGVYVQIAMSALTIVGGIVGLATMAAVIVQQLR